MSQPVNVNALTAQEKRAFLDSFDTVISDCDGVIWHGAGLIGDSPKVVDSLRKSGKQVYFVTNNSTKTGQDFFKKFQKHGFNVDPKNVYCTSTLAAKYVHDHLAPNRVVYVIGRPSISEELQKYGIESFGPGKEEMVDDVMDKTYGENVELRDDVGAVVVGFDHYFNYAKMLIAASYLKRKDCLFVGTNTDETFPGSSKYTIPGSGAVLAGVRTASGREPFIIGKPSRYVADVLLEEKCIDPNRTLFVGDRCNTDVMMGKLCNFKTLLVLSGVHSMDDVKSYQRSSNEEDKLKIPDYYANSFADLC